MIFHSLEIDGLLLIEPKVYEDHRGYFFESFNEAVMKQNGIADVFVQDNQSCSKKNVLRGLHFQTPPFAQGKLVRVIQGAVLDIAVDIRKNSPTFGKHVSVRLDGLSKKMFWIPPGFAHGFLSLEDDTIFSYKCTALYHPASERTIVWNDLDLGIAWGTETPVVADKDTQGMSWREYLLSTSF